ncbi:imidazole glycerol phosphate synthase subunit HisH [Pseudorhodoplanes sp.]|uniref:imidazole glycerol phosphate synthase subunit HisH n=1 Tax=Pseudorhodoplanes sp. TaxID=1934341 RepID=UPI003D0E8E77
MNRKVTIVDYGIGNLYSVARAFEVSGATVRVTENHEHIDDADRIVLPGVGAFEDGMKGLAQRGQIEPIRQFMASGRPFLGICVGMQLLLDVGEEFGEHAGLGVIPGRVQPVPRTGIDGKPHRIPHIGWNILVHPEGAGNAWETGILRGLPGHPAVYFVHSFAPVPALREHRLADSLYDGRRISAAIRSGQTYGVQFHPEKSGPVGLKIVQNFLSL